MQKIKTFDAATRPTKSDRRSFIVRDANGQALASNGYGSSGGSAAGGGSVSIGVSAASSGVRSNASSLPLCASGTPANELCD
jgi:hypothetical protein